jgi:general stress protein CsbA
MSGTNHTKPVFIIFLLLVAGLIIGLIISYVSLSYAEVRFNDRYSGGNQRAQLLFKAFKDMYTLATCIITINVFLLLGLLYIYVDAFRKTRSSFMLGLISFISVLFLQSLLSLPIIHALLGNTGYAVTTANILGVLPNMLETIALIILIYLSME